MKRWCLALSGLLVVSVSLAQEEPPGGQPQQDGEKSVVKDARGGKGAKSMKSPAGRDSFDAQLKRLRAALELTDEQNRELDKIIESMPERREKHRPGTEEGAEGGGATPEERLSLLREMSEARKAGDETKMKEIRDKLSEMGGGPERRRSDKFDRLLREIEPILNDEQKEKLDKFREEIRRNRSRHAALSPDQLFKAAEKLDLNESQKERLDRIAERFADDIEKYDELDAADKAKLSRRIEEGIKDLLEREQREKFEQMVSESAPRNRGGDLNERGRFGGKEGGPAGEPPREPRKKRRPRGEPGGTENP